MDSGNPCYRIIVKFNAEVNEKEEYIYICITKEEERINILEGELEQSCTDVFTLEIPKDKFSIEKFIKEFDKDICSKGYCWSCEFKVYCNKAEPIIDEEIAVNAVYSDTRLTIYPIANYIETQIIKSRDLIKHNIKVLQELIDKLKDMRRNTKSFRRFKDKLVRVCNKLEKLHDEFCELIHSELKEFVEAYKCFGSDDEIMEIIEEIYSTDAPC